MVDRRRVLRGVADGHEREPRLEDGICQWMMGRGLSLSQLCCIVVYAESTNIAAGPDAVIIIRVSSTG